MDLQTWAAFALASAVVLAIPGPTVMLVVAHALGRGRATAWATVPGVTLGDAAAMTVSLAGMGAVLAASATLFTALKLMGAAYLVWLGIKLWRSPPVAPEAPPLEARVGRAMFWGAFWVTAFNPKSILFFVAFVPQFVDPSAALLPQLAAMEATFLALAAANTLLWALAAGTLRARIARPRVLGWLNRLGGGFLIGAGLVTALARRSA